MHLDREPRGGRLALDDPPVSSMDAIAKGTRDGIVFLLNIIAMLFVMIALVSLANFALGLLPEIGGDKVSLQRLFAYAFRPVMWLIGIPGPDIAAAASLMRPRPCSTSLSPMSISRSCRPRR